MSIPKQWPEIKFKPPFPLLQVASSTQIAQFNLLLPQEHNKNFNLQIWAELDNNQESIQKIQPVQRYVV